MDEYSKYLRKFFERYPAAQMQDIFKFFYQSILGPGHLITSYEEACRELDNEQQTISYSINNEPLYEELGNDTIRVNLRPYIYKKYDIKKLADVFYNSQFTYKNTPETLMKVLEDNKKIISIIYERFTEEEFNSLLIALKEYSFKPFSHSLIYRSNYHPHYRVVNKSLFLEHIDIQ